MVVLVTVSSFHLTVQFVTVNANYMTAEAECHLDYTRGVSRHSTKQHTYLKTIKSIVAVYVNSVIEL